MHNVLPNSRSFISHLERAALRAGVVIVTAARAEDLLTEGGRVTGVACATPQGARVFKARGGVVLASGDFTNDPELKARYMGAQEAKASGVNVTATGDGQKLALKLGARILNGDLALGPELRFVPPAQRQSVAEAAALAVACFVHGLVARSHAAGAVAAVHHELRHHGAGALAEFVRGRRAAGQQKRRTLHR